MSVPIKESTYTHPPLSPHILTPSDSASPHIFSFPKQPISKPLLPAYTGSGSLAGTDSDAGLSDGHTFSSASDSHPQPVSLLTALLHSPDHQPPTQRKPTRPPSQTGFTSARSSVPSTTFSSPAQPGVLQQQPTASILRRGSASSDAGDGVGLGIGLEGLAGRLEKVEERREKVGWADEVDSAHSAPLSRAPSTGAAHRSALKFTVAQPTHVASDVERKAADFPVENEEDEEDEDQDEEDRDEGESPEYQTVLPGYRRPSITAIEEDADSDDGYQEDEEDGMFSDDDDDYYAPQKTRRPSFPFEAQFPFARPTNYTRQPSASPPPAPAVLPPPTRRGRGHIRVDPSCSDSRAKACSRHCSPPPSRTTADVPPPASSPSARRMKREQSPYTSDAGPRAGRAGSPMPSRLPEISDDEEGDTEGHATPPKSRDWRSDDAMFQGQVRAPLRAPPQNGNFPPPPVFAESDEDVAESSTGVRGFLRRASEHLPDFNGLHSSSRDSSARRSPRPSCPPALDSTPALAMSLSRSDTSEDLADRLEKSLGISAGLSRARSLGTKVTFQPAVSRPPRSSSAQPFSADEGAISQLKREQLRAAKTRPVRCPPTKSQVEDLGWSDEAKLKVRRSNEADRL